jgi:hypothetical protein
MALQVAAAGAFKEVEQLLRVRGAFEADDFYGFQAIFS